MQKKMQSNTQRMPQVNKLSHLFNLMQLFRAVLSKTEFAVNIASATDDTMSQAPYCSN